MNKTFLTIIGIIALLVIIFASFQYSNPKEQGNEQKMYRTTLAGEYICLPNTQTEKCVTGLKTETGEYYEINFYVSSQTPPQLILGDRFEANGVLTPATENRKYPMFSITDSVRKLNTAPVPYACNADGKICWDGSVVGRTGSDCQFAACPSEDVSSTMITTSMGQKATGLSVSITPKSIVSDSRCPTNVQCIWAGTVEIRAVAETKVGHGEHTFKLNEPQTFGDFTITLTNVTPSPKAGEKIPDSAYRFSFEVKKR